MRVKYGGTHMNKQRKWTIIMILTALFFGLRFFFALSSLAYTILSWALLITSLGLCLCWLSRYRKSIMRYLSSQPNVMIFVIALLLIEIFFVVKNFDMITWTYLFGLWFSIAFWVFLITIIPKKHQLIAFIISLFFYSIYLVGQDIYLRIFNDLFSFKEASTLREGIESGESMYQFNILHLWVFLISSSSIWIIIKKRATLIKNSQKISYRLFVYFLILIFLCMNLTSQIPRRNQTVFISDYYLYQTLFIRKQAAKHFSIMHVLGLDLFDTLTPNIKTKRDLNIVNQYFQDHQKPLLSHEFTGLFEGKNVIFVLAESYDEIALDPILTPNLYRLKNEGISFGNHYTPVYPRTTSDTEFIINTGLIPSLEDGPTVSTFRKNVYHDSLAHLFNQKGYMTQAFHANYKEFYHRHIIYPHYGYQHFYGQDELGLSQQSHRFDTEFFDAAESYLYPDMPFFNFIITYSGHSPYTHSHVVAKTHFPFVKTLYPHDHDVMNYYRATQYELDLMIEKLFLSLEAHNHVDDTVIVLMGDHYPYTMPQDVYNLYNPVAHAYEKQRGNLYIWSSNIDPYTITKLTSSFDVLPTLYTLFNLGDDLTYYIGHDAFSEYVTPVLFKDYTYYNGYRLIKLYDITVYDQEAKEIALLYQLSKKILRLDYFNRGV